jgi:uncharacterized protein (TIGR03437 family)
VLVNGDRFFAGLTPTDTGLYQLNVTIPSNVPGGIVNLSVTFRFHQ